jgi:hypothetical protein
MVPTAGLIFSLIRVPVLPFPVSKVTRQDGVPQGSQNGMTYQPLVSTARLNAALLISP